VIITTTGRGKRGDKTALRAIDIVSTLADLVRRTVLSVRVIEDQGQARDCIESFAWRHSIVGLSHGGSYGILRGPYNRRLLADFGRKVDSHTFG